MAQWRVHVPDIGEIVLNKRRGTKNIRLSVSAKGEVRVGMPVWAPYGAGLTFVVKQKSWLKKQLAKQTKIVLKDGDLIGKYAKLSIARGTSRHPVADTKISDKQIRVTTSMDPASRPVQERILAAAERSLRRQAEDLLPNRLAALSNQFQLPYRSLKIKKLTGRWGSCSSKDDITLSLYLVQLPMQLIDYVILHELAHTIHRHHGAAFWLFMESKMPDAKNRRKQIHGFKSSVLPAPPTVD